MAGETVEARAERDGEAAAPRRVLGVELPLVVDGVRVEVAVGEGEAGEAEGPEEDAAALEAARAVARPGLERAHAHAAVAGAEEQLVAEAQERARGRGLDAGLEARPVGLDEGERAAGTPLTSSNALSSCPPAARGGSRRPPRRPARRVGRRRACARRGARPPRRVRTGASAPRVPPAGPGRGPRASSGPGAAAATSVPAPRRRRAAAGEGRRPQPLLVLGERLLTEGVAAGRAPEPEPAADRPARLGGEVGDLLRPVAVEGPTLQVAWQVLRLESVAGEADVEAAREALRRRAQRERDLHPGRPGPHVRAPALRAERLQGVERRVDERRAQGRGVRHVHAVERPGGPRPGVAVGHEQRLQGGVGSAHVDAIDDDAGDLAQDRPRVGGPREGPGGSACRTPCACRRPGGREPP